MDDPRTQIVPTVKALTLATTPVGQRSAVYTYFAPNAGFLHPLCTVLPAPGSRDQIAGIYEWYRDMSPDISAEVESFVYDEEQNICYLNVIQKFHIFISPFPVKPARLLVKVSLKKNERDGKHYIIQQEDYYQPEDVVRLVLPFLAPPLIYAKRITGRICGIQATAFAMARGVAHQGMALIGLNPRQAKISDRIHQE